MLTAVVLVLITVVIDAFWGTLQIGGGFILSTGGRPGMTHIESSLEAYLAGVAAGHPTLADGLPTLHAITLYVLAMTLYPRESNDILTRFSICNPRNYMRRSAQSQDIGNFKDDREPLYL